MTLSSPTAAAIIPRATYRLQLHRGFDFAAATALLPYLDSLGISHVYCSPIMRAAPGSLHGYDVVDHGEINPELGGREGFEQFARAARERGMGLLIDLVPNHMAVLGVDNPWWCDILEHGPASRHAQHFDIDWRTADAALAGKLLLPVLGTTYGAALDDGTIRLVVTPSERRGPLAIGYHEHRYPLDVRTWPRVLALASTAAAASSATREQLDAIAADATRLPPRQPRDDAVDRAALAAPMKQRLQALLAGDPAALAALEHSAATLASSDGREALHALLEAQAYRLAHWRVAADDINYRRFFDVNGLAALRMEDEEVFEAVHALPLQLTATGWVDGVRIDHPDGLRDPRAYFERLQRGHARRAGLPPDTAVAARSLYVVAEKIAAAHEDVPPEWALHGTTGYRYASLLTGLFVDARHAARFERSWRAASGVSQSYADMAHGARLDAATHALGAELTVLAGLLCEVAAADRHWRDHGRQTLRTAIAEVAAAMPVYRTYVVDRPSPQDLVFIDWAVAAARGRSSIGDLEVFDMLRACLRLELPPGADARIRDAVLRFVGRFQQFCAPVAAKGVEDTAFYRYHRLVSLNEVGSDPATFGISVKAFHGASADRASHWPHTMLGTSTHDNKRSEDVRNRISVLSEMPAVWRLAIRRWRRLSRSLRQEVDGRPAPSPRDELLLYQTLLGSLPSGPLDATALAAYRDRIEAYLLKAAREAKLDTRWVRHDRAYEDALSGFVRALLGRTERNPLLDDLGALADELAWFGGLNSVSMALIKFASPGVPDVYQGNEITDLSLVDPDNRRPVDYALRQRWLDEMTALWASGADRSTTLQDWARAPSDGRLKLWVAWRLLALRRECPGLFRDGSYLPLASHGAARAHVVAFARRWGHEAVVVVAPRLVNGLVRRARTLPVGGVWADTTLDLSPLLHGADAPTHALDLLSGNPIDLLPGKMPMSELLSTLPVAAIRITQVDR